MGHEVVVATEKRVMTDVGQKVVVATDKSDDQVQMWVTKWWLPQRQE